MFNFTFILFVQFDTAKVRLKTEKILKFSPYSQEKMKQWLFSLYM